MLGVPLPFFSTGLATAAKRAVVAVSFVRSSVASLGSLLMGMKAVGSTTSVTASSILVRAMGFVVFKWQYLDNISSKLATFQLGRGYRSKIVLSIVMLLAVERKADFVGLASSCLQIAVIAEKGRVLAVLVHFEGASLLVSQLVVVCCLLSVVFKELHTKHEAAAAAFSWHVCFISAFRLEGDLRCWWRIGLGFRFCMAGLARRAKTITSCIEYRLRQVRIFERPIR